MLPLLPLLLCLAQDAPELRLDAQPPRAFVGEEVRLEWTLSIPRAHVDRGLGQLYQRVLAVPVELQLAGGAAEQLTWLAPEGPSELAVVNGELSPVRVSGLEEGATGPALVRLVASLSCDQAGALELPVTSARYGLQGAAGAGLGLGPRLEEVRVQAAAATLEVRALPEEGRPLAFTGSVGRPAIAWESTPATGLTGPWVLRAEDPRGGQPPRWEPGPGWIASGPAALGGGLFQYGLTVGAAPAGTPAPLRWPWFDPRSASYQDEVVALPAGLRAPAGPTDAQPQDPALLRGLPPLLLAWALAVLSYWLWGGRTPLPDRP